MARPKFENNVLTFTQLVNLKINAQQVGLLTMTSHQQPL